jgi:hypothetical protein
VLAGLTLAAAPTAARAAEAYPLSGYWPMSEGKGQIVKDISGNGNNGKIGASTQRDKNDAMWVKGLNGVGSALRFDGNDYVSIPDDSSLHQQRLTVEAWVRRDGSPGAFKYIVSKGGDKCEAGSYGLYSSINGGIAFYVYDGKKWYRSPQGSSKLWDGKWHHVAGTYDGSRVRLYVDGWEVGTGTAFSGKISYDQDPYKAGAIGSYKGSCTLTMSGDVDEVRIWRAALPVSQIWSLITLLLNREPAARLPEDASAWYAG